MQKAIRANNEFFEILSADILTRLYTMFPQPTDLDASDVDFKAMDGSEEPERLAELWTSTIDWLRDEGFIRIAQASELTFYNVVLTTRGINALKHDGVGDKLKTAITHVGSEAARKTISDLVGIAVGWIAKTALGV